MPRVMHACKTCPTVLAYEQRTKRKTYCEPCKRLADKRSNAASQKQRRALYGRMSIRRLKELENLSW